MKLACKRRSNRITDQVSIAAVNGPDIVVISGQREATMQVLRQLDTEGVDTEMLNTSNAGHSALIDPMLEPFGGLPRLCSTLRPASR